MFRRRLTRSAHDALLAFVLLTFHCTCLCLLATAILSLTNPNCSVHIAECDCKVYYNRFDALLQILCFHFSCVRLCHRFVCARPEWENKYITIYSCWQQWSRAHVVRVAFHCDRRNFVLKNVEIFFFFRLLAYRISVQRPHSSHSHGPHAHGSPDCKQTIQWTNYTLMSANWVKLDWHTVCILYVI